jgi:peptidoglycan/LPS O-acetylase OafA/YrhL
VGVFFVLSGFILALNYPLTGKWENSKKIRFGIARLARIYPVYLLGIFLVTPVKHLIHHPIAEGVRGLLQISLLQSWWPAAALTWNKPGRSLSNEAFFYLIFPAAGVLLCRISRLRTLLMTLGLLWASAMILPILTLLRHVHALGNSAIQCSRVKSEIGPSSTIHSASRSCGPRCVSAGASEASNSSAVAAPLHTSASVFAS